MIDRFKMKRTGEHMVNLMVVDNVVVRLSHELVAQLQGYEKRLLSYYDYPLLSNRIHLIKDGNRFLPVAFNFQADTEPTPDCFYKIKVLRKQWNKTMGMSMFSSNAYLSVKFESVEAETNLRLHLVQCNKNQETKFNFGAEPIFTAKFSGARKDGYLVVMDLVEAPKKVYARSENKIIGYLLTGEKVFDRPESHIQKDAKPYLVKALSQISGWDNNHIPVEIDFGYVIGKNNCVATGPEDEIVYAQRCDRASMTRFVKKREPEPCSSIVVVLGRIQNRSYVCQSAYIGHSNVDWRNHAIIWGSTRIIPRTETTNPPTRFSQDITN